MHLYKFIEKEFLDSFFKTGCLRLGTIYGFRDIVQYGVSRGDQLEGQHYLSRGIDEKLKLSKGSYEPIISEVFDFGSEAEGEVNISGFTVVVPRQCKDGFIFCTSNRYNEKLFRDWNREESLDSCYQIFNVHGFFKAISNAIKNSAFFCTNSNVIYTEERIDYQSDLAGISPALTKVKNKYAWQFENRSIWAARGPCGQLRPWIIYVPEAIQYCKPFAFLEKDIITYSNL